MGYASEWKKGRFLVEENNSEWVSQPWRLLSVPRLFICRLVTDVTRSIRIISNVVKLSQCLCETSASYKAPICGACLPFPTHSTLHFLSCNKSWHRSEHTQWRMPFCFEPKNLSFVILRSRSEQIFYFFDTRLWSYPSCDSFVFMLT